MSVGLSVFLIDDPRDADIFGCQRWDLYDEVFEACARDLADLDEQLDVEEEELISHSAALKEIFAGELTRLEDSSHIYGWAYELYCSAMGDCLGREIYSLRSHEWFPKVDAALAAHGVSFRYHDFVYGEFPLPFDPGGCPSGSRWDHEQVVAVLPALQAALPAIEDREVREEVACLVQWLERAAAKPGSVLVAFLG